VCLKGKETREVRIQREGDQWLRIRVFPSGLDVGWGMQVRKKKVKDDSLMSGPTRKDLLVTNTGMTTEE
jgi:hypothetical protein